MIFQQYYTDSIVELTGITIPFLPYFQLFFHFTVVLEVITSRVMTAETNAAFGNGGVRLVLYNGNYRAAAVYDNIYAPLVKAC